MSEADATTEASAGGWTEAEQDAMRARAAEMKAAARARKGADAAAEDAAMMRAKIEELVEPDRSTAKRLHEIVTAAAPSLAPKTWYGMPAWSLDGRTLCFFQSSAKFKTRYATFGFSDAARLDDGEMWPTSFALTTLTPEVEARIADLVRRAVS